MFHFYLSFLGFRCNFFVSAQCRLNNRVIVFKLHLDTLHEMFIETYA